MDAIDLSVSDLYIKLCLNVTLKRQLGMLPNFLLRIQEFKGSGVQVFIFHGCDLGFLDNR